MPTKEKTDPRHAAPKPPFEEPRQSPPGLEQEMRTKPDHGEKSSRGTGKLLGPGFDGRRDASLAAEIQIRGLAMALDRCSGRLSGNFRVLGDAPLKSPDNLKESSCLGWNVQLLDENF
jgi:hypothetical protein